MLRSQDGVNRNPGTLPWDSHRFVQATLWLLLAALVISSLTACGWRLRGSLEMDLALPPVYLQLKKASKDLERELTRTLKSAKVELVESRDNAELVLQIENENTARRVLSVDSSGKVQEYELQYSLVYSVVTTGGDTLIGSEAITRQRDYAFDDTQVLAKGKEQEQLFDVMRTNAIQQLMRRLQSLADDNAN